MLDFRPDLDPRTPGLITAISEMIPTTKGYISAPAEVDHPAAFAATYTLAANEVYPNVCFATRWNSAAGGIIIAGTNKKLNVLSFTAGYIDVSKGGGYSIGGTSYAAGEDAYGSFDLCAFGDVIIATNKSAPSQKRTALDLTGATLFSDLGSFIAAPQGNTCCVAANFVFIGDVGNWSTVTGSSDILAWSAIGDHTDWRVNPQVTQSSYAQFVDTPGAITAVRPFKDGIIVFKGTSMYRGRYVGAGPNSPIWDFERISDKIGCVGHRSVVNIDDALVFVGWRDVYKYDGTHAEPITAGIWEWMRRAEAWADLFLGDGVPMLLGHHVGGHAVWMFTLNVTLVWNYKLDRWGMLSTTQTVQPIPCHTNADFFAKVTVTAVSAGVPTLTTTDDHGDISTLYLVQGIPKNRDRANIVPAHYLTTGWVGQPDKLLTLQRVNPIFSRRPSVVNAAVTVYPSMTPGDSTSSGGATMNSSYRFDTLGPINANAATSNFFSFKLAFASGTDIVRTEIVDIVPKLIPAGER